MSHQTELDQVKDLLASGKTEEAANLLLKLSKASFKVHYHSALLLKNRIETLQHNVIDGVLSSSEERIEWARVSKGVVDLVEQIDKGERPLKDDELLPPPAPKAKPGAGNTKWLFWALPVLILIGVFAVPKIIKNSRQGGDKIIERSDRSTTAPVKMKTIKGILRAENQNLVSGATLLIKGVKNSYKVDCGKMGNFEFEVDLNDYDQLAIIKVKLVSKELPVNLPPKKLTEKHFAKVAVPTGN